jgi:hypothetical protein
LVATTLFACGADDTSSPEGSLADHAPPVSASPLVGDGAIAFAMTDLVDRLGFDRDEVILESIEAVEWPDTALGCPAVDQEYEPGPVPGYRILLRVDDQTYDYRGAAGSSEPLQCVCPIDGRRQMTLRPSANVRKREPS